MRSLLASVARIVIAVALVAMLGAPLGSSLAGPPHSPASRPGPAVQASDPVRIQFWIGPFQFELTIGGPSGLALAFDGLR